MSASKRAPLIWKPELLVRDGYECIYCGKPYDANRPDLTTIDHLIPRRRGGPDAKWNLAIACETCNCRKFTHLWPQAIDKLIANLRTLINETRQAVEGVS